jgi:hypothetical protein
MMLYIPDAGGAEAYGAQARLSYELDHYNGKFECETCGRTKARYQNRVTDFAKKSARG